MKLILTLLFVTCASAMSLLGSKKCSWGPSYWCSHVTKARECGAFKHCLDAVWSKQIIKQTSQRPQCDLCQMVIKETRLMLKKNTEQKEVLEFFSKSCKFMPDSDLQSECNYLVNNDLDGLMTLLKSSLTEEQICATVSLCQGFEDHQHRYQSVQPLLSAVLSKSKAGSSKVCNDCITFVNDIREYITDNGTVDQIKEELKQVVCIYFGQEQGLCNLLVDELIPEVMQWLADEFDSNVFCAVLAFCNGTNEIRNKEIKEQFLIIFEKIRKIKKTKGDEECLACEEVVLELKNVISDTTNQKQIMTYLEQDVCVYFGTLANQCKSLVETYSPILFALLMQELNGKTLCAEIGLCQNGTKKIQLPMKQVLPQRIKSDFTCSACEEAVKDIDQFLEETSTQDEVKSELDKICDRLTSKLKADCRGVVDQYTPAVLELIVQKLSPPKVCKKACNASLKKMDIKKAIEPVKKENVAASDKCIACEFVMKTVHDELNKSATKQEIEKIVNTICDKLPTTVRQECKDFVNTYGPAVVQLLINEVKPKTICTTLGLCSAVSVPVQKVNAGGSTECVLCEYAMKYIDQVLAKNSTEKDIENLVNGLCKKLPKSIAEECTLFVGMYGKQIVELLVKGINPKVICTEIKLCPAVNMPVSGKHDVGSTECVLCEFILKELSSELKKNSTEKDIENLLNAVCGKLPSTIADECKSFVSEYTPVIVKLLQNEMDPKQVCTALGVCTTTSVNKVMVKPTPECEVCESVCEKLKILMEQNASQQAIKEALQEEVCSFVPVGLKSKCREIVDHYEDKIMKKLIDGVTPEKVCELLHVCSTSQGPKTPDPVIVQTKPQLVPLELMPIPGQISGVKLSSDQCVTCEILVNYLGLAFKERSTVGAIETFLKNEGCKLVKGKLNKECLSIVQNYTPVIALKFANNIDPKQICEDIKQCPTKLEGIQIRPAGFAKKAKSDSTLYFKPQRKMSRNMDMPFIKMQRLAVLKDKLRN